MQTVWANVHVHVERLPILVARCNTFFASSAAAFSSQLPPDAINY